MKPILMALVLSFAATGAAAETAVEETVVPVTTHVAHQIQALAQVSIVMPQTLTLTGSRYSVPYADGFSGGLPSFQAGAALPLFLAGPVEAQAIGLVGYSFKEGLFDLETTAGVPARDFLRLHRVPMSAGLKFLYHIPWLTFMKPSLTIGGGAQWLRQVGRLEGITESFWIPYYYFSPALTFFENRTAADWFGGFTFGVSYQNDLHPKQRVRAWSFDLSVNLFL